MNVMVVNGRRVETNKASLSIISGRVTCGDGSWYDLRTNRGANLGPGFLRIDGREVGNDPDRSDLPPPAVEPAVTVGPTRYAADRLVLNVSAAEVVITRHAGQHYEVTLEGRPSVLETIRVERRERSRERRDAAAAFDADLVIDDRGAASAGSVSVIGMSGQVISIGGGSVVIGPGLKSGGGFHLGGISVTADADGAEVSVDRTVADGSAMRPPVIGISAPYGRPISCRKSGSTSLRGDDLDCCLDLDVSGSGNAHFGSLTGLRLKKSGSGHLTVAKLDCAQASVSQSGTGLVAISGGQVGQLEVRLSGTGLCQVRGTVDQADIQVSGTAEVSIERCLREPTIRRRGLGQVRVGQIGPDRRR